MVVAPAEPSATANEATEHTKEEDQGDPGAR
jgi:hypothetical protein